MNTTTETAEQKLSRILHAHIIEIDPDGVAAAAWPQGFTLAQLQSVHEDRGAVTFDRDKFRREAVKFKQLVEVGVLPIGVGRPAMHYRLV